MSRERCGGSARRAVVRTVLGAVLAAGLLPATWAGPVEAQNPAPVNAFELEAGRRFDFNPGARDDSNYRITYRGALVRTQGTPFKFAAGLDLTAPPAVEAAGDRNQWTFAYQNRSALLGGSVLEAHGVQPIMLAGIEKLDLRGTASVATDSAGTHLAVGLESPPIRVPGLGRREVSNWIVLGINAQRSPNAGAAGTADRAIVTYRAFVGKAFGWRKSATDVRVVASRVEEEILKQARTLSDGKALAQKIRAAVAAGGSTPSNLQSALLEAVDISETDAQWQQRVQLVAREEADAVTDQPTWALYAESSGWYTADGARDGGPRFRNLFSANADYWFLPGRDDTFLRLRYEHGYEWSTPTIRRKQLFVSLVVRL